MRFNSDAVDAYAVAYKRCGPRTDKRVKHNLFRLDTPVCQNLFNP
jgi:hypothetical protein